jgi:NADH-quinone oxidoreductase subunit H
MEVVTPVGADAGILDAAPLLAFAAVATAFLLVPLAGPSPLAFAGDLPVALYLLTAPTVLLLAAGLASRNVYSQIGAERAATLMFVYEAPLYLALLAPAVAAGAWSFDAVAAHQAAHGPLALTQPLALAVALVALQAKLERPPFDIAEAETELIAGPWTELSGRRLALMRLSVSAGLVLGCVLLAVLFLGAGALPGLPALPPAVQAAVVLLKSLALLGLLAGLRALLGRLRIDQFNAFGWRVLLPAALLQAAAALAMAGGGSP